MVIFHSYASLPEGNMLVQGPLDVVFFQTPFVISAKYHIQKQVSLKYMFPYPLIIINPMENPMEN